MIHTDSEVTNAWFRLFGIW